MTRKEYIAVVENAAATALELYKSDGIEQAVAMITSLSPRFACAVSMKFGSYLTANDQKQYLLNMEF